jgi:hypothetical protein
MSDGSSFLNRMIRLYAGRQPNETPAPPAPSATTLGEPAPLTAVEFTALSEETQARYLRSERDRLKAENEKARLEVEKANLAIQAARSEEKLRAEQTRQAHLAQVGGRADGGAGRDATPTPVVKMSSILRGMARKGSLRGDLRDE